MFLVSLVSEDYGIHCHFLSKEPSPYACVCSLGAVKKFIEKVCYEKLHEFQTFFCTKIHHALILFSINFLKCPWKLSPLVSHARVYFFWVIITIRGSLLFLGHQEMIMVMMMNMAMIMIMTIVTIIIFQMLCQALCFKSLYNPLYNPMK